MRSSLVYVMGSEEAEPSPSSMLSARGATSEAGRADRGLAAMAGAIAARRVEIETREGALGRTCARVDATSAMRCGAGRVFVDDVERRGPLVSARATVTHQSVTAVDPTSHCPCRVPKYFQIGGNIADRENQSARHEARGCDGG